MLLALMSWVMSLSVLLVGGLKFLRAGQTAGVAVLLILFIQAHIRPLIFFLGFDRPFPSGFFSEYEWTLVAEASLLMLLWVAVFIVAYHVLLPFSYTIKYIFPKPPNRFDHKYLIYATVLLSMFSLVATIIFVYREGGFAHFIYAVKIGKELEGAYVFREISTLSIALCVMGLLDSANRDGTFENPNRLNLSTFFWVALILANFFIIYAWGNRYSIAVLTLAILLSWHTFVNKIGLLKFATLSFLFLIILQYLKYLRLDLFGFVTNNDINLGQNFWLDVSTSLHFVQYDAFMLALRDAGDLFDFREGRDFWNGLISWVPRAILPDRETFNIGGWFRQIYEPTRINGWPITVVGSWYVNFGYLGILVGALLSGAIARAIDLRYQPLVRSGSPLAAALSAIVPLLMLDGGVNTGFPQRIVLLLVPLALFFLFLRLTSGRAGDQPAVISAGKRARSKATPAGLPPPPEIRS